ncbi:cyclin-K isoform X2 [Chironomus tepperi]
MPWWYFEKEELKNTPSRKDNVEFDTERRYRREATNFIKECGNLMGLGYSTIHTAIVYLHRFYMFHSFKTFPRFVTACSCLFLAGKVEETPKKCRDIIKKASTILTNQKMMSFGEDPKEEVITMERILLKTIKFDLQIDHPYRFLIEYAKCLKSNGNTPKEQVVQKAWNFINDSLETTLCLQWEPEIIAVSMMYLACKISKYDVADWKGRVPDHQKWWDMFVKDMTKNILEDICHQVLDLYQNPKSKSEAPDSPPQLPPSKASLIKASPPPQKRAKLQQSPVMNPKVAVNHIPVKVSSNEYDMAKVPHPPYGYPSTSYQQPPPPLPVEIKDLSQRQGIDSRNIYHKPPLPPVSSYPPNIPPLPPSRYPAANIAPNQFYQPPPTNNYSHKNNRSNHYHQQPYQ